MKTREGGSFDSFEEGSRKGSGRHVELVELVAEMFKESGIRVAARTKIGALV